MTDYLRLAQARAPQEAEDQDNPYLSIAREQQTLQQNRARTVIETALKDDPDLAAERRRLAQTSGIPLPVVERNLEELRIKERARAVDLIAMANESPVLYRQLTDPAFTATSIDDLDTLQQIERGWKVLKDSGGALASGLPKFNEGVYGAGEAGFDLLSRGVFGPLSRAGILPEDPAAGMAQDFARWRKQSAELADKWMPDKQDMTGVVAGGWYAGLQSLGANLLQLPLALLPGGQGAALGLMGGTAGGQAYGQARDKGRDIGTALNFALSQGAIEYATEKLPVSWLIKDLKAGTPFWKTLLRQGAAEVPGEQIATALQDLNEWAVINPDKPFSAYLQERPSAAAQTLIATLVGTGGQVTVMKGIDAALSRIDGRAQQARQAEQHAAVLAQLDELAKASKLRARDPETFAQFVQQASEDSPVQDVFISANALLQSGIAEQVAAVSPAVAEQLQVAVETGGDVRIPVAEYTTRIAGTDLSAPLLDHLKTDPNGMSRAEAADFLQTRGAQLQQEVERALADQQGDATFKASQEAVRQQVLNELNRIGRFTPQKNEFDATLIAARTAVRAAQLGLTPEAFFQNQLLRVRAQGVDGTLQYGQPVTGEFAWEYGQRPGLFSLPGIEVTQLRGDELGTDRTSIKTAALAKLKAVGKSGLRNADTGWDLTVGKNDRNKIAKWDGNADAVLQAVGGIESLVSNAVLAESHQDTEHHNPDVQGVHRFYAPVEIGGQMYRAKLTVKDYNGKANGQATKLHALEAIEIENAPMGTPPSYSGAEALRTAQPTSGRTLSIADLLSGSTMNDGRSWDAYYQFAGRSSATADPSSPRGAFDPTSNTVALLKNADLSTFLHEGAHYFFENDINLASELVAAQREGTILSEGELQIVADVSALLQWHGVQGDIDAQLAQWHGMGFEEKRSYHERTAESFEAYLLEGKAPSIELQRAFQTFRAWLLNVYQSLKAFLETHPEAGQLNDEVRGVFDRMLASTEQIQLAEQGRSMLPLFDSAMQAGMTPEEFAAYQALGIEATQAAIEELQARGLRDMQWLSNKRGKKIRELQQQAKALRAEQEMAARREIMSQPVYMAWQFLTGKRTTDDQIAEPRRKSDPNILDETQDSLFVAIAKLGGLNKDEVIAEWGIDPADKPQSGLFGKPVWRVTGGRSIDAMVEALAQRGYLPLDEHGKADWHDLEERFAAELRGDKVYSNQFDYQAESQPGEGATLDNTQRGKLDAASLVEMTLPQSVVQRLRDLRMTAKEGGMHPDVVAELFGFSSGDELVRTLAAADKPGEAIAALTDARMLQAHGDLATPEAIERAADAAIHNEARLRLVASEVNALNQATGQRKILASAAREFAANLIARLRVRALRPSQYASAEARAAKAAEKASKAGDLPTAAAEKRNQLLQGYATKAAYDAQAEVQKTLRDWREFANRSDKKLVKAYDIDLVNAVRAILGEYGIAEKRAKKAAEYLNAVQNYDPEMYAVISASVEAAAANAKPWQDLTMEELRGLRDEIDAILHLARRSRQMEMDGDLLDRQEVENELIGRMEAIGLPGVVPGEQSAITPGEQAMIKFKSLIAFGRRVESWVGQMDGQQRMGPFRRYVFGRIKDAADAYRADKVKYVKQFRDLLVEIAPTLKPMKLHAHELNYTFGLDSGGSAVNEILHAILHTGNESNKRKLLLGRKWAVERPDGSLDTSRWDAFVRRMADEGHLTKAHFDFAQGVWDLLESIKPLAQKTHRDVFGKYFDEITASPIETPFGTYAGGYVPAMADPRIVSDAAMRKLMDDENSAMSFAFPTTPKGFTKARVEYNRPLLLDLRTLAQHIDKVLLFAHLEMPVRDVRRVLSGQAGTVLNKLDPVAIQAMITPWLNRSAKQQVETPVPGDAGTMRFFSALRTRAGAAAMFGNIINAAQQVTGFSLAALKVSPRQMLSSTADYMKSPKAMAQAVAEASPYMASRLENEIASMSGAINDILLNPTLLERGQNWTLRHAYFAQSAVDSVMGPIIWTAAYNQAVEQGHEHRDAVRLADSAIRETQGSTLPEDVSRIETGNAFVRMFTQFAGYFNMQANLLGTEFSRIAQEYGLRKGMGKGLYVLTFGFLVPAIVAEAIVQVFRGGVGDEDDDGEYLDDWLAALFLFAPLRNVTAMVPVLGQATNAAVNAWNSKPYDDRISTSPAISMIESAVKAPVSVYKSVAEEGSAQKAVRDVGTLISMSVGLPGSLAARPLGYLAGVADGNIEPTSPADLARGILTGAASKESRVP